MPAAGDDPTLARFGGDADEHGLQSQRPEFQPDLIILGHAVAGEGLAVLQRGELRQRLASDSATDSGQWYRRADRFAYDQFLNVRLGELIAIMTADPARMAIDQREYGQLDYRCATDQSVEYPEFEGWTTSSASWSTTALAAMS